MITPLLAFFPQPSAYDTFVDAYGGSGVVLLNKPRCAVEIYNDLDDHVANLFTVLIDPELFARFKHLCDLAPYDEALSNNFRARLAAGADFDPAKQAFLFYYVNR